MTVRLYYQDAYCTEFDAEVLHSIPGEKSAVGIILDRTCFYPTSGGQPYDTGSLAGQRVVDVVEVEGDIVHWVAGPAPGKSVHGQIDWKRRFDHMQQHSGQHILSQAFLQELGAQTVSFHLGDELCTIDLDRPGLEVKDVERVEDRANAVVFADRPITTRFVQPDELPALGLRKMPTVEHDIRVVEVEGFDRSPCGGTHCARSGEVGAVAIRKWERRSAETRVEFVCGWRALHDYRWKTAMVNELALAFSVKDRELASAVQRLLAEAADARRELNRLRDQLLTAEASRLLGEARPWNEARIVVGSFPERDVGELRRLAALLVEAGATVALLGVSGQAARLIFARSEDVTADMAMLLRKTCQAFGGKGGGQPNLAQGGGFPGARVDEALEFARSALSTV